MLLKHLVDYYEHEGLGEGARPENRWDERNVFYAISLREDGTIRGFHPLSVIEKNQKPKAGQKLLVPHPPKTRTSNVIPYFLCDKPSYLLGIPIPDKKGEPSEDVAKALECFQMSKELHLLHLPNISSKAASVVCRFFESWNPTDAKNHPAIQPILSALQKDPFLVFETADGKVLDDPAIVSYWNDLPNDDSATYEGICLVTGKVAPICKTHPQFTKSKNSNLSGPLISFNENAYESYGTSDAQGINAHVSQYAASAYSIALRKLLNDPQHAWRCGDTMIVSWAEKQVEECQSYYMDNLSPNANLAQRMKDIREGRWPADAPPPSTPFYILGLAPQGKGRISIKFFLESTFGAVITNLFHHYERLALGGAERSMPSIYGLLRETFPHRRKTFKGSDDLKDGERATDHLVESVMKAIFTDSDYPRKLYMNILHRIHFDQNAIDSNGIRIENRVTPRRVMMIKAYLMKNQGRHDIPMALNPECKDPSYVLGRVFAELEDIQYSANRNVQKTIQSTYLSPAARTPGRVFPILLGLSQQHLAKLKRDNKPAFIKCQQKLYDIFALLDASDGNPYPKTLTPEDQGMFFLGYYHQHKQNKDEIKAHSDSKTANAVDSKEE